MNIHIQNITSQDTLNIMWIRRPQETNGLQRVIII